MLSALPLLALLGCPADRLGVSLPQGGKQALGMEDFRRDVMMLERSERRQGMSNSVLGREELQKRMEQMHLLPAFDTSYQEESGKDVAICGMRIGSEEGKGSGQAVLIAAQDQGRGAHRSAGPLAALISLAKTYDSPAPPPYTLIFCRIPGADGAAAWGADPAWPVEQTHAVFWLSDMGQGALQVERREGVPVQYQVHGQRQDWFGGSSDRADRMNYEALLQQTQALRDAVDQAME